MLFNFSSVDSPEQPLFLTQDETDILVESEKLDRRSDHATVCKPELL